MGKKRERSTPSWSWQAECSLPSETGAGQEILDQVLGRLRADDWPSRDVCGVHLALEEALVNAIKHGNCHDGKKQVHVCCKLAPDRLWIEIADEGTGFDPCAVPDPTAPENIERTCGRGLLLMKHFMSRVEYNARGNQVVMEKERSLEPHPDAAQSP